MASRDEILKAWDEAVANFGVAREGDLDVAASLALTLGFEVARSNRPAPGPSSTSEADSLYPPLTTAQDAMRQGSAGLAAGGIIVPAGHA
jgi:hypothetical protein